MKMAGDAVVRCWSVCRIAWQSRRGTRSADDVLAWRVGLRNLAFSTSVVLLPHTLHTLPYYIQFIAALYHPSVCSSFSQRITLILSILAIIGICSPLGVQT